MVATDAFYDRFVAQEFSKLKGLALVPFGEEFADRDAWYRGLPLRTLFHGYLGDDERKIRLVFWTARKAQTAIDEWELACAACNVVDAPVARYFRVLRHLEASLAALWQGLELVRTAWQGPLWYPKSGQRTVTEDVFQTANRLYNISKHCKPEQLDPGDLQPIYLATDGLKSNHTGELVFLSYDDMRELLEDLGLMGRALATNQPELLGSRPGASGG